MNEYQQIYADQQYDAYIHSLPLGYQVSYRDLWNAAMEHMWGQPLTVGNLHAKLAELEERLQRIGQAHRDDVQPLEARNQAQAQTILARDQTIKELREEVETWKRNLDQFSEKWKEQVETEHQADIEEAIQNERVATQAQCERTYRIEIQKALENERAHFEALKETILAGQRIVMLDEFNRQYHALEESWSRRLDERGQRADAALADQREVLLRDFETRVENVVQERLQAHRETNFHEEMEKLEVENRELRQKVEEMEKTAIQQISDFTDRFLADDEYRRGVLEDAINTRIDQGVIILKGMVALELRRKPDRADYSLILPSEDDFDAWWNGIHWSAGPDLLDWEEALSRVRLS